MLRSSSLGTALAALGVIVVPAETIDYAAIYLMRQVTDVSQPDLKFGASLIGGVTPGWRLP